jgi:hypothetical protein
MNTDVVTQKILRFIDKNIWLFHVSAMGYIFYVGIKELLK